MQANEHNKHSGTGAGEQNGEQPQSPSSAEVIHNNSTEVPRDIRRLDNTSPNSRPEWRERGRIACREGRQLTANPFGKGGLSAEGHIRAEEWLKGWTEEAIRTAYSRPD